MSEPAGQERISLGFVGDICLSLGVIDTVRRHGADHLFAAVRDIYGRLDLVVGNLECCILDRDLERTPQRPPLLVPPDVAAALCRAGIGVYSLANNHTMDGGADGLASTIAFLDRHGLRHFGAGPDLAAAEAPLVVEVAGRRIALIGACDVTESFAAARRPGIAPFKATRLVRRVRAARDAADLVVVVLHADIEFVPHPAPYRRKLSRQLVDEGAHMVLQHHPHVCQATEEYRGALIAYSLGNHVFHVAENDYQSVHEGTDRSMVLEVDVDFAGDAPRLSFAVHPLRIDATHRPVPAAGEEASLEHRRMELLNAEVRTAGLVERLWRRTCRRIVRDHVFGTYYELRRTGIGAALASQLALLRRAEDRRWLIGFLSGGYL